MEYQDEISAFLDAENSITARWLANTLRIDMTKARTSLSQYKNAQPDVSVSFLITGVNGQGGLSYIISDEVDISNVRNQLSSTRSEELYALHKIKSISNKAELQALECEQASELLYMTHPNSAEFYKNSVGYILCPNMDVKPVGQRILSSKITVSSETASEVRETIKASVSKVLAPVAAPTVLKSKSSIQATNFFGASATKPKAVAEAPASVKAEPATKPIKSEIVVEATVGAPSTSAKSEETAPEPKKVGKIVCDDEDEEWDSGYQPDAARLKERVDASAAARVSVGAVEDVVEVDMSADGEESAGEGEVAKAGRKKGKALVKHGAMDDYMEDIAIAAHIKAEATPADAPKPKKRKLVEKVRYYMLLFQTVSVFRERGRRNLSLSVTVATELNVVAINDNTVHVAFRCSRTRRVTW